MDTRIEVAPFKQTRKSLEDIYEYLYSITGRAIFYFQYYVFILVFLNDISNLKNYKIE